VPLATLAAWSEMEGIDWHGHAEDVVPIWRDHHVACLPSRGGEGLPRTLLEAAACGRALVTTDVPGCRSFVRHGEDGLVVPPDDAAALAEAFLQLAGAPETVAAMGRSARARVLAGHTERQVRDAVKRLYGELLALP
jgi:glycosyltransferase involved in cell wall biosynthesis